MKALVFQHLAVEHPGIFREFFARDGVALHTVELDEGGVIPSLDGFDLMVVMGGPQDVWQEAEHSWLIAEKRAIRQWVMERQKPYLGICLGHQLLAASIGGAVALAAAGPEVGVMAVAKTPAGEDDPLLAGLPRDMTVFQWHGAEVTALPSGAVALATSPACAVQALRFGECAYGLQFHIEITAATVGEWGSVPAYEASLEAAMGAGALAAVDRAVAERLPAFNEAARRIYDNFMRVIGKRTSGAVKVGAVAAR